MPGTSNRKAARDSYACSCPFCFRSSSAWPQLPTVLPRQRCRPSSLRRHPPSLSPTLSFRRRTVRHRQRCPPSSLRRRPPPRSPALSFRCRTVRHRQRCRLSSLRRRPPCLCRAPSFRRRTVPHRQRCRLSSLRRPQRRTQRHRQRAPAHPQRFHRESMWLRRISAPLARRCYRPDVRPQVSGHRRAHHHGGLPAGPAT
jgi:hypothetical protein